MLIDRNQREMIMTHRDPTSPRSDHAGKILVIGGGFAGFWAAVAARRVAGDRAEICLISPKPVLEMRPRLYEPKPETLSVPLLPLLAEVDVTFISGKATDLDASAKTVTLSDGQRHTYDRLVVATGSQMPRPPIPGVETAYSIDDQADAIAFDQRLDCSASRRANDRRCGGRFYRN